MIPTDDEQSKIPFQCCQQQSQKTRTKIAPSDSETIVGAQGRGPWSAASWLRDRKAVDAEFSRAFAEARGPGQAPRMASLLASVWRAYRRTCTSLDLLSINMSWLALGLKLKQLGMLNQLYTYKAKQVKKVKRIMR